MNDIIADAPAKRGRPRSAEVDGNVLMSAVELAGEVGLNAMSMDSLAERAGVSKATIYRRWASKEEVVIDALRSVISPFESIDTGSLRGDIDIYFGEIAERLAAQRTNVLPHLIEAAAHDPAIRESLDEYVQFRRDPLIEILGRAVERGELPPDADIDVMSDVLIGPILYRRLLSGAALDDDFFRRLVALVLPGL